MPSNEKGTGRPWRQQARTKVADIAALTSSFERGGGQALPHGQTGDPPETFLNGVRTHLDNAIAAADGRNPVSRFVLDAEDMERAYSSLDAAEDMLLRAAPEYYVRGRVPAIYSDARKYLEAGDPRRLRVEAIHRDNSLNFDDLAVREALVTASAAAHSQARKNFARVRSFSRVLGISAVILGFMAVGLAILGVIFPNELAPCFHPENKIVCPSAETTFLGEGNESAGDVDKALADTVSNVDVALVELLGLVAAAISGASSLRSIRGTSTPYSLPVALALLKLPTGALTAYAGLVLMRGNFVPGLSALDSAAQILAWAVVFGAAQQVFTGLVDRQAHNVLDNVGGKALSG